MYSVSIRVASVFPLCTCSVSSSFYKAMIEQQEQRNAKVCFTSLSYIALLFNRISLLQIARFESELQDRKTRELSMLQMRNERQQHAVKQFEEEADRDRAWESFVQASHRLSCAPGGSEGLRRFVEAELLPTLRGGLADKDANFRRGKRENLVQAILNGKVPATIAEMNALIAEFGKHATVTCSAEHLTQLVHALGALQNEVSAAVRANAGTVEDAAAQVNTIKQLLNRPLIRQLECSGKEAAKTVRAARDKVNELTQRIASEQSKAAEAQREREQLAQQHVAPQKPQPGSSATSTNNSTKSTTSSANSALQVLLTQLPYLSSDATSATWLTDIRQNVMTIALPEVLEQALSQAVQHISYDYLRSNIGTGGEDAMMSDTGPNTPGGNSASGVTLAKVDAVLAELEGLLHAVVKGGSQAFLRVFLTLSDAVLTEVQDNANVASEQDILLYAVLVCGMFRALSAKMHAQSAKIFQALLLSQSTLCVPNLVCPGAKAGSKVCLLYAALVGHAVELQTTTAPTAAGTVNTSTEASTKVPASPLTSAQGWEWLQRAATQLHLLISLHKPTTNNAAAKALVNQLTITEGTVAAACRTIRTFLRLAGHGLFLRYQTQFSTLLTTINKALQSVVPTVQDAAKLSTFLEAAVRTKYIVPAYYRGQAPFMLDAASLTRYGYN
jgi:uncharacterized coiled-coil protein SlyX